VPRLYFIRHAIAINKAAWPKDRPAPLTWKQIPPDYAAQIRKRALPTRGASQAQFAPLVGAAGKAVVYQPTHFTVRGWLRSSLWVDAVNVGVRTATIARSATRRVVPADRREHSPGSVWSAADARLVNHVARPHGSPRLQLRAPARTGANLWIRLPKSTSPT